MVDSMYLVRLAISVWQPNSLISSYRSVNTLNGYFPIVVLLHSYKHTSMYKQAYIPLCCYHT